MQQLQSDGSYNELLPKADAWTKDETLSAQVASVLGLRDNYKPDDAFLGLYFGAGTYRYRVRVVFEDGTPVQGSTISGISAIQGQSLVTNEQGYVIGKSTSQSVTISCTSPFIDQKTPDALTVNKTGTITDIVLTLKPITNTLTITSSGSYKLSNSLKSIDVTLVGGGGAGGGMSGSGGGGGYVETLLGYDVTTLKNISFVIGSGGTYVSSTANGGDGGTTQFKVSDLVKLTAKGGKGREKGPSKAYSTARTLGGIGNRNGRTSGYCEDNWETYVARSNGMNGSGYIFNDSSLRLAGGGGGRGGSERRLRVIRYGGSPNGGKSASGEDDVGQNGIDFGGGGGGGSSRTTYYNPDGGNGGSGGAYLRFHF